MSKPSCLPVILVSAKTTGAASRFISEIIEEEESTEDESKEDEERQWVIENKYYSATVALRAAGDDADAERATSAEAHVVLLQRGEGEAEAARRLARAPRAPLALLAVDGDRVPAALAAWAAAARLEPVELRPAAPPPARRAPFGAEAGVPRVRDALHAHHWPGLRRRAPPAPAARAAPAAPAAPDDDLERFAAAAEALSAVARLPPAERRAHADSAVLALARALRLPLDDL